MSKLNLKKGFWRICKIIVGFSAIPLALWVINGFFYDGFDDLWTEQFLYWFFGMAILPPTLYFLSFYLLPSAIKWIGKGFVEEDEE